VRNTEIVARRWRRTVHWTTATLSSCSAVAWNRRCTCVWYDTMQYKSLTWTKKLSVISLIGTCNLKQKYIKRRN